MKGWLDNFGKANNANDSKVSMSEDFVGLGYNTEGRNYSPAWGGQFQIGGKLNPVSPTQQIQQAVEPTPTVPYLQTKDPAEFYKSWIQNPEYERRLKATGYSDVPNRWSADKLSEIESVKKERLNLLENIQPLEYDPSKRSEAIIDYYDGSTINVNPSDYKTFSKQSVEAHEIAHVATPQSTMGGNEFGIFMGSMLPSKKPVVSGVQGSKEREASKEAVGDFEHLQKPWEAKADLDALRFMMYDKGIYDITKGKKFTETDFEKVKQSFGKERVFKRFTDKMGKENFVKLMNTIALADDQEEAPIAMGGMSIPGSVGFSYARVAGAAPSKGKYAKKTMASAQNGIMSPMLLARNVLNYFYPSEEAAPAVEAAPVNYKKGLTNELLQRQAYKESTFNPAAVSPAGYKGLTQIGEGVLKDYSNKKGGKKLDPFNPEDAVELQKFAMDDLYNASFINKPNQSDSVRIAKTLAAYNWGRGNLSNYLNEQKSKGVDIYDSYDWLNNLPKETSDYVNKILLQEDPSFNKNYKKASTNPKYEEVTSLYDQKIFGGNIPSAQNGQEMRFYQNGLDWKPKSMQPGGNIERVSTSDPRYPELYKNRQVGAYYDGAYSLPDLDEVTVTSKRPSLYEDLRGLTKTVGETAAEFTGVPGTIRFSQDPMENIKGLIRTGDQTGLGLIGLLPGIEQTGFNYNDQDIESAFNTLDAFGLASGVASGVAGLARRPIQKGLQQTGEFLTTQTSLKNAYKINPWAFKPNSKSYYRGLGQVGLDDAFETGVLRANATGKNLTNGEVYNNPFFDTGRTELANALGDGIISEVSGVPMKEFSPNHLGVVPYDINTGEFLESIPVNENVKFLQKDWLRGFKPIKENEGLKKVDILNSSPVSFVDDVDKGFKSEIDWSKWNPETPNYPELINEYNTIEESTKNMGTWMRNSDGSAFQGTPEQFVQQQSSYFKKAYPKGYDEVYRGVNRNNSFSDFNENTDSSLTGARGMFTADKDLAESYIFGEKRTLTPFDADKTPGLFELIYPKGKQITYDTESSHWTGIDLEKIPNKENLKNKIEDLKKSTERKKKINNEMYANDEDSGMAEMASENIKAQERTIERLQKYYNDFDNIKNDDAAFNKMKKALDEKPATDDIAKYIPETNLRSITLKNIIDGGFGDVTIVNNRPGNYLKSKVGNVGFFDLKNPNVYKGVIPAGIATALTVDQQKNGGITKDNQGYWNPENWGKPVEIDSNDITMEGVYEPLLGVSDTGDTKLMKPGKNYKFKGKKVTEYPVAKLGINQLDAQPMKKLNQLLNFTNNPDKDNWLDKYN